MNRYKKTVKIVLFFIATLSSVDTLSQDFTGNYISYSTSFSDEENSEKNFEENAEFNIVISEVYIAIQDPRIPQKVLVYKITEPVIKLMELNIYKNCINEHLNDNSESTITIYEKEGKLNLMISDKKTSQMFFNLKTNQE